MDFHNVCTKLGMFSFHFSQILQNSLLHTKRLSAVKISFFTGQTVKRNICNSKLFNWTARVTSQGHLMHHFIAELILIKIVNSQWLNNTFINKIISSYLFSKRSCCQLTGHTRIFDDVILWLFTWNSKGVTELGDPLSRSLSRVPICVADWLQWLTPTAVDSHQK